MSFAEQLAARAAKKRSSAGSICESDGGGGEAPAGSLAGSIQRRAAEKAAAPTKPTTKSTSTTRPKEVAAKPKVDESAKNKNGGGDDAGGRMSFGTAIKAKSSIPPIDDTDSLQGNSGSPKPVAKYREPKTKSSPHDASGAVEGGASTSKRESFNTSIKKKSSIGSSGEPEIIAATGFNDSLLSMSSQGSAVNKRGSFNSSINSLSASIKQRRVSDINDDGMSPGDTSLTSPGNRPARTRRDMNDLVDDGDSDDEGNDHVRGLHVPNLGSGGKPQPYSPARQSAGKAAASGEARQQNGVEGREKAEKFKSEHKKKKGSSATVAKYREPTTARQSSLPSAGGGGGEGGPSKRESFNTSIKKKGSMGSAGPNNATSLEEENRNLRGSMMDLRKQLKEMEIQLWQKDKVEEENTMLRRRMSGRSLDKLGDTIDWSDKSSSGVMVREVSTKGILKKDGSEMAGLDQSGRSELSRDDLMAENVRLSQMLLEIGQMEELEKMRTNDMSAEDKNSTILHLKQKLKVTERELSEVTELKNAEIEVLRKQLNRAEHLRTGREQTMQEREEGKENEEREGLREEIRRLNKEVSALREKCSHRESYKEEEKDDDDLTSRYASASNGGPAAHYSGELDSTDVDSLQSIIGMMRQTIDQSNKEKDMLEQRLAEEQERSQMELKAFARTLEGVDDLRKSAESMSREIRRIKVKGYRPTRSDLLGGAGSLDGVRNFGELTAAVEASESMEDAIRMIESQNDAMEERRRMGVVASRAAMDTALVSSDAPTPAKKKADRYRGGGLSAIPDDGEGGGFLSFWNNAGSEDAEGQGDAKKREEKKKKSKRKSKKRDDGSVLTSFF